LQPPPGALCLRCNYELRDLPQHRCPECGQPFDPVRLETMNLGRPLGGFARFVLGPLSWPTLFAAAVPTLFVLWIAIDPTCYADPLPETALLVFYALAVGAILLVRWIVRMGIAERHQRPAPGSMWRDRRARWLLWTVVGVIAAVILHLPLYAGFWISKPWLDQLAAECRRDPVAFQKTLPRRAGVYEIAGASLHDGEVRFFSGTHSDGFTHDPQARGGAGGDGRLSSEWSWFSFDD
jgi:hypothetical protein